MDAAALAAANNKMYFFKVKRTNTTKTIKQTDKHNKNSKLNGIPRDLDAAALAAANNKMYFFKVNRQIQQKTKSKQTNTAKTINKRNNKTMRSSYQPFILRVTTTGDLNLGRNLMSTANILR